MREHYVIRTPNGYVGRWGLAEPLTDNQPFSGCYCYDSSVAATLVASEFLVAAARAFHGAEVEADDGDEDELELPADAADE